MGGMFFLVGGRRGGWGVVVAYNHVHRINMLDSEIYPIWLKFAVVSQQQGSETTNIEPAVPEAQLRLCLLLAHVMCARGLAILLGLGLAPSI